MKKTVTITMLAALFLALPLTSETIDYPGDYLPGDPITADGMNTRFSLIYTLLNGWLDTANIEDGTIGSSDLASDVNSLAKVSGGDIVNSGGFIGIGTDTPRVKLELQKAESTLGLTGGGIDFLISDGTPQIAFTDMDAVDWSIYVNQNRMRFIREPWQTTMTLLDNKVGIGTDSPDTMLEIATAESASGLNGSYGDIRITDSEPQIEFIDDELEDFAIHVNNSKMYFINEPWDKIMVLDSGKVGIGTDAPDVLLEIATAYDSETGLSGAGELRLSHNSPQMDFIDSDGKDFAIHVNDDKMYFISEEWDSNHMVLYNGNVGIQTSTPAYTLHVAGSAYCTSGSWAASDARYKENITPIQSSLEKLSKIDGVNFTWKPEFREELHVSEGSQIGFIAQEVEKEFPELVNTDPTGYKAVAYDKFTAVLLQAIKEQQVMIAEHQVSMETQQALIEAQQEQIDEMRLELDRLLE